MADFLEDRVKIILGVLEGKMYKEKVVIKDLEYTECGYKGKNNAPDINAKWLPLSSLVVENGKIKGSENQENKDSHIWVKGKISIPESFKGKNVDLCINSESQHRYYRPQVMIYLDSVMVGAFDRTQYEYRLDSNKTEYDVMFYSYFEPGLNIYHLEFSICLVDDDVYDLYFDLI